MITRDDLRKPTDDPWGAGFQYEPITDEEFDRLAREAGYVKRSECFAVWANTPVKEVRIELEAEDE